MNYKAYVINMEKSVERRDFMERQLKELHIPFELCPAIDGKIHDFTDIYDEGLAKEKNGSPLSSVERGCALSHRSAIEKAMRDGVDYAIILEDDVEFPKHFKAVIEHHIKERSNSHWEYLSFNYPTVGIKYIKLWLFLLTDMLDKQGGEKYLLYPLYTVKFLGIALFSLFEGIRDALYRKLYPYGKAGRFYRPMYLAGCYLITRSGMEKMNALSEKLIYPADRIQNIVKKEKGLALFYCIPLFVKQRRDTFGSTMNQNEKYIFSKYD